jgi:predicted transposase/invertase (TIGR01784 family)
MIHNPHDALFRAVLGQPEHARGTLQSIVPVELAESLDWSTLTLQPGSFIDTALRGQYTDLLYAATRRDGSDVLVYFLFEHQSTIPEGGRMALRLLRYQAEIWNRWSTDHPDARRLPMIIPLVMYHGAAPWSAPLAFDDLLDTPPGARPSIDRYLVRFEYVLHDLSQIPDDQLHGAAMMTALAKLVSLCFKHARTRPDFLEIFAHWIDVVREVAGTPNGWAALNLVMRYIIEVNEHLQPEALQALMEREVGPQAKDAVVTAGQQLIEQGFQQGERAVLLRQLRRRFGGEVDTPVEQRIATASIEQVELWVDRVLSAATLAEIFAD